MAGCYARPAGIHPQGGEGAREVLGPSVVASVTCPTVRLTVYKMEARGGREKEKIIKRINEGKQYKPRVVMM
jgi:hypothetical protein